jgi:hypothetical protein
MAVPVGTMVAQRGSEPPSPNSANAGTAKPCLRGVT